MIVLKNIKGRNFRAHRAFEFTFYKGVNAVVGPNGRGKSTIEEIITFLFTGKIAGPNKESAISIGESSGYASGEFTLHGKDGYIERHLDATKVILRYDGVEYKKASEVKEVWDKLLNVNNEIFEKLVIAKQGEIPLLFSGDKETRSKVFQKIFLVPNVNKIRDVIWNDYVKTLPPQYPVENMDTLMIQYGGVEKDLYWDQKKLEEQYSEISLDKLKLLEAEIARLEDIKRNAFQRAQGEKTLQDVLLELDNIDGVTGKLYRQLGSYPFTKDQLEDSLLGFNNSKTLSSRKDKLAADLDQIQLAINNDIYNDEKGEELDSWLENEKRISTQIDILNAEIRKLNEELALHAGLSGHAVCPTCGQSINDIALHLGNLREQIVTKQEQTTILSPQLTQASAKRVGLDNLRTRHKELLQKRAFIEQELLQYKDVEYDAVAHALTIDALAKINETVNEISRVEMSRKLQANEAEKWKKLLLTLEKHPDDEVLHVLLNNAVAEKEQLYVKIEEKNRLNTVIEIRRAEFEGLKNRIDLSTKNQEENTKRDAFYKLLVSLYDAFHPNQFSKKVIQKYSGVVTDYLLENVNKFNLPYFVSVNEEFGIDVMNRDGYLIPKVSGGQEMIIGLCLRLALMQIFAQSFGFMIIDEATRGLDVANQDAYFQVVRELSNTQLEQVIIIDHNEKLAQYVDHTISLN